MFSIQDKKSFEDMVSGVQLSWTFMFINEAYKKWWALRQSLENINIKMR